VFLPLFKNNYKQDECVKYACKLALFMSIIKDITFPFVFKVHENFVSAESYA